MSATSQTRSGQSKSIVGVVIALTLTLILVPISSNLSMRSPTELQWAGGLAITTLASEDVASITAGQMIATDRINPTLAIVACMIGIIGGDLTLWYAGRLLGGRITESQWLRKKLGYSTWKRIEKGIDHHPGLIFTARFIPGMRLPIYLLAGATGFSFQRFSMIVVVGSLLWVPTIILLSAKLGETFTHRFEQIAGTGIFSLVVISLAFVFLFKLASHSVSQISSKVRSRGAEHSFWEFWPSWTLYIPVFSYLILRHPIRFGLFGLMRITAVNPGIPLGGLVGESKVQILSSIRSPHVLPFVLIPPGIIDYRLAILTTFLMEQKLEWPVILKPDQGERGAGVRLIKSPDAARNYLLDHPHPILAQAYHPGPYEAGVFYYRLPGEKSGKIFSITDKVFPIVTGDGQSTLRELIASHPRLSHQMETFSRRHYHRFDQIIPINEKIQLAIAGNHCQGTMFRDGMDLHTSELANAIDRIAKSFDGFNFGRFDIRYSEVDGFRTGTDLAIVELNGLTSEATHIYDPNHSIWSGIRTLVEQWSIALAIAEKNLVLGARSSSLTDLLSAIKEYQLRLSRVEQLSD